jgi:hypothetical protein
MNLLRSICCLVVGRCAGEKPKPTKEEPMRAEPSVSGADLGQKEAELEKGSEEQLRNMEGGEEAEAAAGKKKRTTRSTQHREK